MKNLAWIFGSIFLALGCSSARPPSNNLDALVENYVLHQSNGIGLKGSLVKIEHFGRPNPAPTDPGFAFSLNFFGFFTESWVKFCVGKYIPSSCLQPGQKVILIQDRNKASVFIIEEGDAPVQILTITDIRKKTPVLAAQEAARGTAQELLIAGDIQQRRKIISIQILRHAATR